MIVRKPYAFLIKKFRLTHVLILLTMIYLFLRTNSLYTFFNKYSNNLYSDINVMTFSNLINIFMFIILIGLIIILFIIYFILREKKKPTLLYLLSIIFYMLLLFVYIYVSNQLSILKEYDLNIKASRLTSDILLIVTFIQVILIILFTIRSTGFDVKKFEFTKDIDSLEANEKDREELEVVINFDKDSITRFFYKSKRELVYYYQENKLILFSILGAVILITLWILIANTNNIITTVREGKTIIKNNIAFTVEKSYITKQNYKGKILDKNNSYLIIKFKVSNLKDDVIKLNLGYILVNNGGKIISINESNREAFFDIGIRYESQNIQPKEKAEYIIAYEVPDKRVKKEMILINNVMGKNISLKPVNIDKKIKTEIFNAGDKVKIEYLDSTFNIDLDTLEINNVFEYQYELCIYKICRELNDKIIAGTRRDILKIHGEASNNKLLSLIKNQSEITYELDDKKVSADKPIIISISGLVNKELYFNIDEEKEKYDSVYLNIYIRNNIVKYKIK